MGKDTNEVDFRNRNEPKRGQGSKLGNKRVMLHGLHEVIKKKKASSMINEVGLGSDILSLVNNTRVAKIMIVVTHF